MRCLNEYVARRANKEDDCTGRFREERFKSQALLDEAALLSCMAYVDLNPVRAGISETLGESEFTSIQARIRGATSGNNNSTDCPFPGLMGFQTDSERDRQLPALPIGFRDYIDLVDWTGRIVRADKRGFIAQAAPPALLNLNLNPVQWQILALEIQKESITMLNGLNKLAAKERSRKSKVA